MQQAAEEVPVLLDERLVEVQALTRTWFTICGVACRPARRRATSAGPGPTKKMPNTRTVTIHITNRPEQRCGE